MINWPRGSERDYHKKYLFRKPPDVFEVGVRRNRCPHVGIDVSQGLWQEGGDVGVDGGEPGIGSGAIFTAQHHCVLTVWGMELQQSEWEEGCVEIVISWSYVSVYREKVK